MSRLFQFSFPLFFILLHFSISFGQSENADSNKKVTILPVPAFGYSPETGAYIGAVSLFAFDYYTDSITRTSNAKLEFNFTWRKQIILESEWNYFFKEENWFSSGLIHFSKYPDLYYGIGESTPENNEVVYNSNRIIFSVNMLKKARNKFFIGQNIRYILYQKVSYDNDHINYPELQDGRNYGLGITFLKDTRNNLLNSTKALLKN